MMNEMKMTNVDRFLETDPVRAVKNSILLYRFMLGRMDVTKAVMDPETSSRIKRALADIRVAGEADSPA